MAKRIFDIVFSLMSLIFVLPFLFVFWVLACFDTNSFGIFFQQRIGQYGKPFTIFKLRSMHIKTLKISRYGAFIRNYKIDEIPQLLNVLLGKMSIVGFRPDIIGYYDTLKGENRKLLEMKPGLTSKAALKYWNEERILNEKTDPLKYNDEVIFPDKVKINLAYYYQNSLRKDLKIIFKTILGAF